MQRKDGYNIVANCKIFNMNRYLPKTHEIVVNSNIKICSARSMYGEEYPGDFGRWKMQAFKNILSNVDKYVHFL